VVGAKHCHPKILTAQGPGREKRDLCGSVDRKKYVENKKKLGEGRALTLNCSGPIEYRPCRENGKIWDKQEAGRQGKTLQNRRRDVTSSSVCRQSGAEP